MSLLGTLGAILGGFLILLLMVVLFGLAYVKKGRLPSIPFLLSVLLVGLLGSLLLPWNVSIIPTFGLGERPVIVGVALLMLAWMVLEAWWASSGNPETIARSVSRRLQRLFSTWIAIGTLGISLGFSLVVILAGEGAEVAGIAAQVVADVPLISSNIGAIGIGWLGAGGSLPLVGGTLPAQYQTPALIAGAIAFVFVLAVGVTYAD
ncbi:hypothetical protein [Halobellus sp. H-GB7]|uniref:hypothetical protein n=1 Tax=Halobellus sp. H-GB7 TaxID=3069756 RepID=UPI0027B6D3A9|nr:hypothetical protein [Halobellus sp. H-GB7]MDQ2054330.1 hypothetical protein [Halobellus sp. H-GB7]